MLSNWLVKSWSWYQTKLAEQKKGPVYREYERAQKAEIQALTQRYQTSLKEHEATIARLVIEKAENQQQRQLETARHEAKLIELTATISTLTVERDQHALELATFLEDNLDADQLVMEPQLEHLVRHYNLLAQQICTLNADLEQQSSQLDELNTRNNLLSQRYQNVSRDHYTQVNELQTQLAQYKTRCHTLTDEHQELTSTARGLLTRSKESEQRAEALQNNADQAAVVLQNNRDLSKRINKLESELKNCNGQLMELKNSPQHYNTKALQHKIDVLNRQMALKNATIDNLIVKYGYPSGGVSKPGLTRATPAPASVNRLDYWCNACDKNIRYCHCS